MKKFNSLDELKILKTDIEEENGLSSLKYMLGKLEDVKIEIDSSILIKIPTSRFSSDKIINENVDKSEFNEFFNIYKKNEFQYYFSNYIDLSCSLTPCYYNDKKYIYGVDFISFYAYDFNLDYDFNLILIDYDYFIDFFKDINFKKKKSNIICEIKRIQMDSYFDNIKTRNTYKREKKIIPHFSKKEKANLLKHFCYYNKNKIIDEKILKYFGIHQNSVNNIAKRLVKVVYSNDDVQDCLDFIFNKS